MDEGSPQPKISLPERIFIGLLFLALDTIEIFILFLGLDDFWVSDALASTIFIYLKLKGVTPVYQLIGWAIELVPYVGALPLKSAGWIVTCWVDSHPQSKTAEVIGIATAVSGATATGKMATARKALQAARKSQGREAATPLRSLGAEGEERTYPVSASKRSGETTPEGSISRAFEEGQGESRAESVRPGAQLAEEIYEENVNPMRPVGELLTQTPATPQPTKTINESSSESRPSSNGGAKILPFRPQPQKGGVQIQDDGTVDLRRPAA